MNSPQHAHQASAGKTGVLLSICMCHLLHDGLADVLYVFLPLWKTTFVLSHAQVGLLVTLYCGTLAAFQIPAGILAERTGERRVLVIGTTVAGLGFVLLARAGGITGLAAFLVVAGLGSGVQHPLGASLVSRAWGSDGRRAAIGTYNFAGDLGKVLFPTCAGVALLSFSWPAVTSGIGVVAITSAVCFLVMLRRLHIGEAQVRSDTNRDTPTGRGLGIHDRRGFAILSSIGIIDTITRYGLLTLLPFLLIERGQSQATVGLALGLLFAGGAVGKFLCGFGAQRFGVLPTVWLTEAVTGGGILVLLIVPANVAIALLPVIGAALNGTSSVLYGSVADYVHPQRQARAFGVFYTIVIASGAVAPLAFGTVSDLASVESAITVAAMIALITIPLASLLERNRVPASGDE